MKTYYDAITAQINAGLWEDCMAMFDRAWTLDFYYRLYCLVLKYEPQKKRGYAPRMAANNDIIGQLGGIYAQDLKAPENLNTYEIRRAVSMMEKECSL